MRKIHAKRVKKSSCCRAKIYHFGKRRRQCVQCLKTWRIRQCQRGQKTNRVDEKFFKNYLDGKVSSLSKFSKNKNYSIDQLNYKLKKSLDVFLAKTSWPTIPAQEKFVVIADALMQHTDGKITATYLIALKPLSENRATILKPLIELGWENDGGWRRAFAQIPKGIKKHTVALVCDGKRGLRVAARENGWLLQRCHFHALGTFQRRLSHRGRYRELGQRLYEAVVVVLKEPDQNKVGESLKTLCEISLLVKSKDLKKIILEFIKHHESFRTYLHYPKYHLPTTTGSLESLNSLVRDLLHRTRGFRTIKSLTRWTFAFLKNKKFIRCNGSNFQPN